MNSDKDKDKDKSHIKLIHCRCCRYYRLERGGAVCQRLEIPVKGSWSACCLAAPPFAVLPKTQEKQPIAGF